MTLCEFKKQYRLFKTKESIIELMSVCEDKAIQTELDVIKIAEKHGMAHDTRMVQERIGHLLKIKDLVAQHQLD